MKRHRQDKGRKFCAGVVLADAGIRYVIEADPDTVQIFEPVGKLRAAAELAIRAEINPAAATEVPDRGARRHNKSFADIDVEADAAIAVEGALAGTENADERGHNPQQRRQSGTRLSAKPVVLLADGFMWGNTSKRAAADRDPWRIGWRAET